MICSHLLPRFDGAFTLRCILHIGPMKTGSTSIQYFLRVREKELADRGYFIPRISHMNMAELPYSFMEDIPKTRTSDRLGISSKNVKSKRLELLRRYDVLLRDAEERNAHTCIFTSEILGSFFQGKHSDADAGRLQHWLSQRFSEIAVVMFLRRQDLWSVSDYKNRVKNHGQTKQDCLSHDTCIDWQQFLTSCAATFGRANLRPLLFPDSVPEPRDLITDFCHAAGIDSAGLYTPSEADRFRRNAAIDGRAIELLRQMNEALPERDQYGVPSFLRQLEAILMREVPECFVRPSKSQVQAFLSGYHDSNEAVRAVFFSDRRSLFSNDISYYPDRPVYPAYTMQEVAGIMCRLIYNTRT